MAPRKRLVGAAASLLLACGGLAATWGDPASAGPAACPASDIPTITWDGGAGTDAWSTPANWDNDHAPGSPGYQDVRACLPAGSDVVIEYNNTVLYGPTTVAELDLAPGATLRVTPSGRLMIEGAQSAHTSYVRRATGGTPATLELSGVLGGEGELVVDGVLHLSREPSGPPTMGTRLCEVGDTCLPDAPATTPGRTTVGTRGLLRITGTADRPGSQLQDRRTIDVRGEMRLEAPAYLAVDNGTTIIVRSNPEATLRLSGSADVYQGRDTHGDPVAELDLDGTLAKTAAGNAVLDLTVNVGPTARSVVNAGLLSVGGDVAPAARVGPSATYGVGRCDGSAESYCSSPTASEEDPQTVSVTLPRTSTRADISIEEHPELAVDGDLGPPVDIHVDKAKLSAARPMIFTMRLDSTKASGRAPTLTVLRKDGTAPYRAIPACRPNGTPPTGRKACVSSRRALADNDVLVRIRTQVNSRWIIR